MKNLICVLLTIFILTSCSSNDDNFDKLLRTSWIHNSDDLILNLNFYSDGVAEIKYNKLKDGTAMIMNIKFKYEFSHSKIKMESTLPEGLSINGYYKEEKIILDIDGQNRIFDKLISSNF